MTTSTERTLTRDEWLAIRETVTTAPWDDPARLPECLKYAMEALRDIACGVGDPYMPSHAATQALRGMAYRAKTGAFPNEPREPAWSLDAPEPLYRHVLDRDDLDPGDG